jgi:MoxR-like ATPase
VTQPGSRPAACPASGAEFGAALQRAGYFADESIATACHLALCMGRPVFCEGDPGVGKTSLARAVAEVLGRPLYRLQCYEGLGASEALYDWNFPAQLLHLRAAESAGARAADLARIESELYERRFLLPRPVLRALEDGPSVLLVDEIDRADDEFEAFLLEVLSDFSVTVPELGTIKAATPPFVVLTSNRTREVHDALKRRCLYLWVEHPSPARELTILKSRFPALPHRLAEQVVAAVGRLRVADLLKPPGVAESLDWAEALLALQAGSLDPHTAALTLGAVVKYREDQARVGRSGFALMLGSASS